MTAASLSGFVRVLRLVPRVERGEQINVGVIVFSRPLGVPRRPRRPGTRSARRRWWWFLSRPGA